MDMYMKLKLLRCLSGKTLFDIATDFGMTHSEASYVERGMRNKDKREELLHEYYAKDSNRDVRRLYNILEAWEEDSDE